LKLLTDEFVAEAVNGQNKLRVARIGFELSPQPCDVNINGARRGHRVVAPDFVQQLIPRKNRAAMLYEVAPKKEATATPQPERRKTAAPAFSVTSLEGKQYDLASLRGKTVVLNFWFLGCPPCVAEVPELNKLVAEFKDKNVIFLALALDDEKALRSFLKEKEFKYQVVPNASDIIMGKYEVGIFPTHIILDAEGNIASELIGNKQLDKLRAALRQVITGQAAKAVAP